MSETFYVAVDGEGIEHNATGNIAWPLPGTPGVGSPISPGHQLELRRPIALLGVLDECIFEATSTTESEEAHEDILKVPSARLGRRTGWNTKTATRFAIECAKHVLGDDGDVPLPDGTTFAAVLSEASASLDKASGVHAEHLGNTARLLALHKLNKERRELGDIATALIVEDNAKDVDALDDPSYDALEPLIDAVLAAISALRHHALFGPLEAEEEQAGNRTEHRLEDASSLSTPVVTPTPWGPIEVGGFRLPHSDPSWVEAREAARHALVVATNEGGNAARDAEASWQADRLAEILAQ